MHVTSLATPPDKLAHDHVEQPMMKKTMHFHFCINVLPCTVYAHAQVEKEMVVVMVARSLHARVCM